MIELALEADRNGLYQEAAEFYERLLTTRASDRDVMLRTILLYWQATQIGIVAHYQLPTAFVHHASARQSALLALARQAFPMDADVEFWERYIAWADLGEPFTVDEARNLLRRSAECKSPALYLYTATRGTEAIDEAALLLSKARDDGTAGARYIVSVLESAMRHHAQGKAD